MAPLELIKAAFEKWIPRLGLAWWDIDIIYYDDPREIIDRFRIVDGGMVPATVTANWMYASAEIRINLPAFDDVKPESIERIAVHELCHILVNEMREDDIHHEERVVTGLTKAFFWVEDATIAEMEIVQMASPIEMVRGNERCTCYDDRRADALAADGWQRVSDLSAEKQAELRDRPPSPWTGYDDMTAQEVIAQAEGLPPERIDEIVAYESGTKGRVSIVNKLLGRAATSEAVTEEAPSVTVETVIEKPMETVETVQIVEDEPKGKGK